MQSLVKCNNTKVAYPLMLSFYLSNDKTRLFFNCTTSSKDHGFPAKEPMGF